MADQSIYYPVPLIPQPNSTSCWAASMAMVVSYWERATITPEQIASAVGLNLDSCYGWDVLYAAAHYWRLRPIPSGCYTGDAWLGFLIGYGPLWLVETGSPSHAVVLKGGDGNVFSINDPWPPGMGDRYYESLQELANDFEGAAGAVGDNVQLLYRLR